GGLVARVSRATLLSVASVMETPMKKRIATSHDKPLIDKARMIAEKRGNSISGMLAGQLKAFADLAQGLDLAAFPIRRAALDER
ncbi:MAG: hypothetical protein P8163_18415, partial [Candidatus Thiodiazotropha sp.]